MPCIFNEEECNSTCEHADKTTCPNHSSFIPPSNGITKAETIEDNAETKDNLLLAETQAKPKVIGVPFSKDNQPTGEAKSLGKKRKAFTRDTIRSMLNTKAKLPPGEARDKLVQHYGEEIVNDATWGELMTMRQLIKGATTDDTQAFTAVVNQGMGMPVQAIAQTNMNGEDLPTIRVAPPAGFKMSLPSNTDGDEKPEDNNDETKTEE